jgi:hypothetical protein
VKISIVFIGKPQWEAGWPFLGYDNKQIIESTLNFLGKRFSDIEFISHGLIGKYVQAEIDTIKNGVLKSDGLILYTIGHYGDPGIIQAALEIIELGKPTILMNKIYSGDHSFIKIYTTPKLKAKNLPVVPVSSVNIEAIERPLEILNQIYHLAGKTILVSALDKVIVNWDQLTSLVGAEQEHLIEEHPEFLEYVSSMMKSQNEFYTDLVGKDQAHQWRIDEQKYQQILRDLFKIEMKRFDPKEIVTYYNQVNKKDAKVIADEWIKTALKVVPSKETLINSARLYLGFKALLKDHNSDVLTPDCGTMLLTGYLPAYPCMAFFKLANEGCHGICESDVDSTISYLFGYAITGGRTGFVSNHTLDLTANRVTYMHCLAPNRPYGSKEKPIPFEIRRHGETHFLGASPRVIFPVGEKVTTIKISVLAKKIAIRQGTILDNVDDEKGCISKLLVESNARKILDNYDWATFGWHRVTFLGDWKEDFILAAKLVGLTVFEEDK